MSYLKEELKADDSTTLSDVEYLNLIDALDSELSDYFSGVFSTESVLTRQLVSFQANKKQPMYRWYKYKEAFSADLVEYLVRRYGVKKGRILDPFAGMGTTLFASSELGFIADGIELLPIGQQIIATRQCAKHNLTDGDLARIKRWQLEKPWKKSNQFIPINTLRITDGAYPSDTEQAIGQYMAVYQKENDRVMTVLRFALLCVLESVSYTRKDGQYLRWDYRSGRRSGKNTFNKGKILTFEEAISAKLEEIISDIEVTAHPKDLFDTSTKKYGEVNLLEGSCLQILPTLKSNSHIAVITSPPYCNRYDYTRTYALEHALLGVDEIGLIELRQQMLSCTVENRAKDLCSMNPEWEDAIEVVNKEKLLQAILAYLEQQRIQKKLNNNGIPRMVKGYFYEMACVVYECARILGKGELMFTVNDNVRYAGASISVDMILSHIAEGLGFNVESILVLPQGKGNSSQQMGRHGREALRKCVYVWRKIH